MPYTNEPIFIGIVDDCQHVTPLKEFVRNNADMNPGTQPLVADYVVRSHLRQDESPEESARHFLENQALYKDRLRLESLAVSFVTTEEPTPAGEHKGPRYKAARVHQARPFGL